MTIKHKKVLLMAALVMSGIFTVGCADYADFKKNAVYEVSEEGYAKITGYVDGNELKNIKIMKSTKTNSIYFCYYDIYNTPFQYYDIFSGVLVSKKNVEKLDDVLAYIINKDYDLKARYTEEDLRNIYDEYVNEYNENNEDKSLGLDID